MTAVRRVWLTSSRARRCVVAAEAHVSTTWTSMGSVDGPVV